MRKGIRTVENASNENQMSEAIVASVKKTPFHCVQMVSEKLKLHETQFASRMRDTDWIRERMEDSLRGILFDLNFLKYINIQ
ncbi:unnamed protein product [Meloidogyne enterolobii]|uniref:Uncharacterized protein n=1 Tax=Meloidogyne enterolobii TaxID=390850 RepID=A0ACB0ZPR0_MELEN